MPERFAVGSMLVRDAAKGRAIEEAWGVSTVRDLDAFLASPHGSFVVVSVPWPVTPVMVRALADRGVPALAETPPAPDLEGLHALHDLTERGARVQVAEQYNFQPLHAARLALARSGVLGRISQAQVSAAHGYHGVSLIRALLDVLYEPCTIQARAFVSPLVAGPNRDGPPAEHKVGESRQVIAHLDYGDRLGVFDFTGDQYFSWVRSPRVLVRGERGEINNQRVSYLEDFRTPVYLDLQRVDAGQAGNLEGYYHKGILAGSEWVYRNPFAPARLTDDEIAIATSLHKMADYAAGGPSFYSLAEASHDHYISTLIERAARSGETVATEAQPWL
jgi:predicted dehydrogenase